MHELWQGDTRRIDDNSESNLSFCTDNQQAPQNFRSFQVKIGDLGLSRGIAVDGETGEDCFRCGSFSTSFLTVWHEWSWMCLHVLACLFSTIPTNLEHRRTWNCCSQGSQLWIKFVMLNDCWMVLTCAVGTWNHILGTAAILGCEAIHPLEEQLTEYVVTRWCPSNPLFLPTDLYTHIISHLYKPITNRHIWYNRFV